MALRKDIWAGAFFCTAGAFFVLIASQTLRAGTAFRMGPGYMPQMVGGMLVLLGLVIMLRSFIQQRSEFGAVSWRGIAFISASTVLFGLLVRGLGVVPTVFICCMVAAYASRRMTLVVALAVSVGMTVFSSVVFIRLVGIALPLFGPWTLTGLGVK